MASITFIAGTVIPSTWLNDVNALVYGKATDPGNPIRVNLAGNVGVGVLPSTGVKLEVSGSATITGTMLVIGSASTIGYGTGAGGVVTQLTNKSTGVTLNKATGRITMNNASLAPGASVQFIVSNSLVTNQDCVFVNLPNITINPNQYTCRVVTVDGGSFTVSITNTSGGALGEAVPINFVVIKGAIA